MTKRLWACLKAERRHRDHLRQRVTLTSSTLRKSPATDHEKDWTRRDCAYQGGFSAWKKLTASWQEIVDNQTDTIAIDMLRNKNDLTLLSITAVEPVGTQGFVLWARDSCELWYCTASKAVVKNMFQSTAQKRCCYNGIGAATETRRTSAANVRPPLKIFIIERHGNMVNKIQYNLLHLLCFLHLQRTTLW